MSGWWLSDERRWILPSAFSMPTTCPIWSRRTRAATPFPCCSAVWRRGPLFDAQIFRHAIGGDVAGGADDGAGRMTAGAARVQTLDRGRVRHPLVESDRVVDVVDVPVAHPEVFFDFLRGEREDVHDRAA